MQFPILVFKIIKLCLLDVSLILLGNSFSILLCVTLILHSAATVFLWFFIHSHFFYLIIHEIFLAVTVLTKSILVYYYMKMPNIFLVRLFMIIIWKCSLSFLSMSLFLFISVLPQKCNKSKNWNHKLVAGGDVQMRRRPSQNKAKTSVDDVKREFV